MTFYVRRASGAEIEGPFAVEQINEMVRHKRLTFKSLANVDTVPVRTDTGPRA